MAEKFKITYSTLSVDNDQLHADFDVGIERVKAQLGKTFPLLLNGKEHPVQETFPVFNPADPRVPLFYFSKATRENVQAAVEAAGAAAPIWRAMSYQDRNAILYQAADKISENRYELSAAMIMEMGKNRVEALADVEETADLIRWYCHQMEQNEGYVCNMNAFGSNDTNISILKPYGVWAVIAPFNFPLALSGGPVGAALATGNTVVVKPSSDAPYTTYMLVRFLMEAGIPPGAVNFISGSGGTAGKELVEHPDVAGITFTGSYEIGFRQVYKQFATKYPKPVVAEMGGKNPAIVSDQADLDKAAQGVLRSAYGMGGQKCSACSRVYVQRSVYDAFMDRLVEKTKTQVKIGDPLKRDTFLGPLGNQSAYENFKRFVAKARADGKIAFGGNVLVDGEWAHGFYVEPTIVDGLSQDHELVQNELFVPIICILPYDTLDEAIQKANDVVYGLTAGFFSEDEQEARYFLDNIEAGVVYVNRASGATTGAWPGYQTFGGWKASGSSGRNIGGPWSLLNYVHEQSQTIIRE
ncbi:MAG: aldehyde dehydrogenase family protein [Anaerolineae bacterium]|nr:aldehyde dehydrogenase family protein [Anaerolineae bacterium]